MIDYIVNYIIKIFRCFLLKFIKPDFEVDKVTDINYNMIEFLKEQYNIEAAIVDVDDTLRKDMNELLEENKEWLIHLNEKLQVIVLSNGYDGKVHEFLDKHNIKYIYFAFKPLKVSFNKVMKDLNLTEDKFLVIGDSVFDDIFGGKRNGMLTALVKEV